jgi:allantoin racemase
MVREGAEACDAVLIGVSLDTAIEQLRRECHKPIVGMTGAALAAARRDGRSVGVLTIGETMKSLFCERFGPQAADHVHAIALDPRTAIEDPARAIRLLAQGVEALAACGARVAVPIGATVAGLAGAIEREASIPVLDSMACAVREAERLAAAQEARP